MSNNSVSLRQLRAFIAVATEQSFTRAADKLDLSQSSVSTLVHELEANLGLRLFDRHTRQLHITQAGAELLPMMKKAVSDIDSVILSSSELKTLGRGRVSIAASSVQAALVLPHYIKQFALDYPDVKVELHDVAEHQVTKMVSSGEVDFGIGTESVNRPDLTAYLLSTDAFVVMMRADHALAHKRVLRWRDLTDVPVIGPPAGNPIRDRLDQALAIEGVTLSRLYEVYLPLTMVGMVEAGLGVAVMSTALSKLATGLGLVMRNLADFDVRREVSLITHADRSLSPTAQRFRDILIRSRFEAFQN